MVVKWMAMLWSVVFLGGFVLGMDFFVLGVVSLYQGFSLRAGEVWFISLDVSCTSLGRRVGIKLMVLLGMCLGFGRFCFSGVGTLFGRLCWVC